MEIPETEIIVTKSGSELLRKTVRPGDYIIGCASDCDVHVEAELVSRRHAQLTVNYDHALIEDLGSSNGTFVNGQPVNELTRLWPNQKIQIGAATVELRRIKAVPEPDVSLAPTTETVRRVLPTEFLHEKKYDIGGVVAQGGMGAILNAKEATTERTVAMKVMLHAPSPEDMVRFISEAKLTAQLEHPNVVPVHELSVDENENVFYTMKFVRGITLRKVLELLAEGAAPTVRKYPLGTLITVFQKVCDAVAFAHSKQVIHRDLKPENIMIGDYGEVLVMDWGLAKVLDQAEGIQNAAPPDGIVRGVNDPAASATMAGTVMGTPQYMSPEQARGEVDKLDARTDIYALGAILYHILVLHPPIAGDDAWEVVNRVAAGKIDPLPASQRFPHLPGGRVPDSLAAVVRQAMAFDPAARYVSVPELQKDIEAYQGGFATRAENAGVWKQIRLLIRRNKTAAIGVAAVLLVGATFGTKAIVEGHRAERALSELRKTLPTLLAQAEASIALQKFDEALDRLDLATTISPHDPNLLRRRANLLQAMLRFDAAANAYQQLLAVQPDSAAEHNLELCRNLLAKGNPDQLSPEDLSPLYDALMAEKRVAEAAPLGMRIGRMNAENDALVDARIKPWKTLPGWNDGNRVHRGADGYLWVALTNLPISDLTPLSGLAIHHLFLQRTKVTDLSPLRGMPLSRLDVGSTAVKDLEPLRGMKLTYLGIGDTKVDNLDVIPTLPLTGLDIYRLPIRDLSFLRGMKLEILRMPNTNVESLEPLRGMPLRDLDAGSTKVADLAPLAGMPIDHIILNNDEVLNIEPLRAAPLVYVSLSGTRISDFSPLAGKQLILFSAAENPHLSSIEFLRGTPLVTVSVYDCPNLKDVSVLAELPTLKKAVVPRDARGIELLRKLPKLDVLGYSSATMEEPAAQFWKEFDAAPAK